MRRAVRTVFKYLLALFFIGAGINHFRVPDFYISIMPDYVPAHAFMVYLSGVTEIVAGVMLAIPALSKWGAWFIIAHLVVFLSVHFWMIQHAEDRFSDIPLWALWLRVVLQVVLIVWASWFVTDGRPKPAARAA